MEKTNTLIQFITKYNLEEACLEYLVETKFKDGKTYKCASCRKKFNVKTGTIFEASKTSFQKWFLAIFLLFTNKKG